MKALRLFGARPDHPLAERGELERTVAGLAASRPAEALQELQHWFGTLSDCESLAGDERFAIVQRLDQAGQSPAEALFAEFVAHVHRRDRPERARAELLRGYWDGLRSAYARCVTDDERAGKAGGGLGERLPLALARSYRAAFLGAKVRAMMYLPIPASYCDASYPLLSFAECAHFDATPVRVYEREARSAPRAELLKLLALRLCRPHDLPPEQVELAARILGRLASSFAWASDAPPSRRQFGAGTALGKLADLEAASAANLLSEEMRFGREYTQTQLLTVLRHLQRYLGPQAPRRATAREKGVGTLEVLHGFDPICASVTAIDVGHAALGEDLRIAGRKAAASGLQIQAETVEARIESWAVVDRSAWGLGASIPAAGGGWAEPGVLCAVRERGGAPWAVAIVRRLEAAGSGPMRCGLQILSRKPVSVWLRVLGRQGEEVSNWETSTGDFAYDYARAIVLADGAKHDGHPVLLLAAGKFVPEQICEIVMGEHSRHIRLGQFLEQGADYLRAAFSWMPPPRRA